MYDLRLRQYTPKYFKPFELCSQAAYKARGTQILELVCTKLLISLDDLRIALSENTPEEPKRGILTCNDWFYGGQRQFSCLRFPGEKYHKDYSGHSLGMAADLISKYYTGQQLRDFIIANREKFPYITRIEGDVNWLHIDVENLPADAPKDAIEIFYTDKPSIYV
ncbi:TPA: hypothetical protein ACOJPC_003134 [Vibrio fluvialis]|uniref:hypothetical protein n=1 Tax=Vibrio fluvialis TaxID=676 RepID=UPI001F1827B1|nr:hypothetical protein [Vibrio fluvialis]MCE7580938.1 hypothetical protein [Vibrio fluvialis]WDY54285.1 hypothetical protein PUN47_20765 [Vibrio fluvialis]